MNEIKVALLCFAGAGDEVRDDGRKRFNEYFPGCAAEFTNEEPDVLFFASGGSEKPALQLTRKEKLNILIGDSRNNSYSSATEVKAWLNNNGYPSMLLHAESEMARGVIQNYHAVKTGLASLNGQRLGLIGEVSEWLVASDVSADALFKRFGIELVRTPWSSLPAYDTTMADEGFLKAYANTSAEENIENAGRVHSVLASAVSANRFDAITVECFSLVKEKSVTACLSLAHFNNGNFCAACEGDLASAAGMMLGKALTGAVPWMANINRVSGETALFSHCTIAPRYLNGYAVDTHFETGKGTSIRGTFRPDEITVFRMNDSLTKAFIAKGKVAERPFFSTACRTQIEVELPERALRLLREAPLGNHHLIFEGDCSEGLSLACAMKGIEAL